MAYFQFLLCQADEGLWLPLVSGTLIHHRLAPSRCWYSWRMMGNWVIRALVEEVTQRFKSEADTLFNNLRWMENWVSFGRKGHTKVQILAELGIESVILWLEGRNLYNCANHDAAEFFGLEWCCCLERQQILQAVLVVLSFTLLLFLTEDNLRKNIIFIIILHFRDNFDEMDTVHMDNNR